MEDSKRPLIKDIFSADFFKTDFSSDIPRWVSYMGDASWREVIAGIGPLAVLSPGVFGAFIGGKIGHSAGLALGFRSKKVAERLFAHDYVSVILSLAFSLHGLKLNITSITDTEAGAACEADIPTDWRSFAGKLYLEVVDDAPSRTLVYGNTVIKGQLFDWGKGKKYLTQLFESMEQRLNKLEKIKATR